MLRGVLVAALCVSGAGCKVVHSTPGVDADTGDRVVVGFDRGETNAYEGAKFAVFVKLSAPVDRAVTVTFVVNDITAILDRDYVVASRSVTFSPGGTMRSIGVSIAADDDAEPTESFALEIAFADGLEVIRERHVVMISPNAYPFVGFDTPSQIDASGNGGIGSADPSSGGGGGGSGGMILLVAEAIESSMAYLVANGGGGAEGSSASAAGADGDTPTPTAPLIPAHGGSSTSGGNGGNGFAQGAPATGGSSATKHNDAGGGGGGAGYIVANQPLTGAIVSPAP